MYQSIIISKDEYKNGFKISEDSIYLFKNPIISNKLLHNILHLKKIIIIENNLYTDKFSNILQKIYNFLNSLDEDEFKYSLTYFKFNVINNIIIEK